jgi:hypothetical protein
MADFQWEVAHIEWFLDKFKDEKRGLSARDILPQYRPKKGEPRKGKSRKGEQTIDTQDFRNLMRNMVSNEFARVVEGSYKSKNYKIRMVSDDYPYVQEVFGIELFSHPHMIEPMPGVDVVKDIYLHFLDSWTESHQQAFEKYQLQGYMYVDAFYIYNYRGGDFDLIFDQIDELDLESPDVSDWKQLFILHVLFFISAYKAFAVGIPELREWLKANHDGEIPKHHDTFFAVVFRHQLSTWVLLSVEVKNWRVPHRTVYNNSREVWSLYEQGETIPRNLIASVTRGFNPSEDSRYFIRLGYAREEINTLRLSDRPDVRAAVKDADTAFFNIMSFHNSRYGRSQNSSRYQLKLSTFYT